MTTATSLATVAAATAATAAAVAATGAAIATGSAWPTFSLTLYSACGAEKTSRYAITAAGEVAEVEDGEWTPDEPEEHTENAVLYVEREGQEDVTLELTGDNWRDLENYDVLDELLLDIAGGRGPAAALKATLAEINV